MQITLKLQDINDGIDNPEAAVTLSSDLVALLLRLLPSQSSVVLSGGEVTRGQLNILLTLAINLTKESADIERLVAALLRYL